MRILFVCMGNICRSPTAQGVIEQIARTRAPELEIEFDSAGTHGYHVGQPPDQRTQAAAAARGYDLSAQRARQVDIDDFDRFDLVLAMDENNLAHLRRLAPTQTHSRIRLLLEYVDGDQHEVPDPFYGSDIGFERVLDLVEAAAEGLLASLRVAR
jgi:protein-tyrosine phosphatase